MNFLTKVIKKVEGELNSFVKTVSGIKKTIRQNVIEIIPRIYQFPFPKQNELQLYSEYFNEMFGQNYTIWNLSEHRYDYSYFHNQVSENIATGYPTPTLDQLFLISKDIISYLNSSNDHIALIHCQSSNGRSALLISCILCLIKKYEHPLDAFTFFCEKVQCKEIEILFASQKQYLIYFQNILHGLKQIRIVKITMNEIPYVILPSGKITNFCPYLQIFKDSSILYNSLSIKQKPKDFYPNNKGCQFEMSTDVSNDLLIRCKHFISNNERLPIFRVMFNTKFVFTPVIKFQKNELDFSEFVKVSDNFVLEIHTEESQETAEQQKLRKARDNLDYIVKYCLQKVQLLQEQEHQNEQQNQPQEESFDFSLEINEESRSNIRKQSEGKERQENEQMMQQLVERQQGKMKKKQQQQQQQQKEQTSDIIESKDNKRDLANSQNEQELIRKQLDEEINKELQENEDGSKKLNNEMEIFQKEEKNETQDDEEDMDEYMKRLEESS